MNILEVAILKNQFQVSELELGGHPRSIKTRSRLENDPKTDVSFRRGNVTWWLNLEDKWLQPEHTQAYLEPIINHQMIEIHFNECYITS